LGLRFVFRFGSGGGARLRLWFLCCRLTNSRLALLSVSRVALVAGGAFPFLARFSVRLSLALVPRFGCGSSSLLGARVPLFLWAAIAISVSRDSFISSDLAKKKLSGTIEQLGKDSVKTIRLV
jgi:hypothetical protein